MVFTRREETRLRELIKLGTMDAVKSLKEDIRNECMTRTDCLSMHQGRYSPDAVHGNNGNLRKEKQKFWGAVTALIITITSVITTVGGFIIVYLSR